MSILNSEVSCWATTWHVALLLSIAICGSFAMVEQQTRHFDSMAVACFEEELKCNVDQKCIPFAQICDGVAHCSDGSDEKFCSPWNLISRTSHPSCGLGENRKGISTFEMCKAMAVARLSHRSDLSNFTKSGDGSIGILFKTNEHCVMTSCMNLDAPSLTLTNPTGNVAGAMFFAFNASLFSYNGCTNELSCNSHGVVESNSKPCECRCDPGYGGMQCEIRLQAASIIELWLMSDVDLTTTQQATISTIIGSELRKNPGMDRVVASISRHALSLPSNTRQLVQSVAKRVRYAVTLTSVESEQRAIGFRQLLSASTQQTLFSEFNKAIPNAITELVSSAPLHTTYTTSCQTASIEYPNAVGVTTTKFEGCSVVPPVESLQNNKHVTLIEYAVTFDGVPFTPSLHVSGEFDDITNTTIPCDDKYGVQGATGCPESVVCHRYMNHSLDGFTFRPTLTRGTTSCGDSPTTNVLVSFTVAFTPLESEVALGEEVSIDASATDVGAAAGIASLVCFGLCFIFVGLTVHAHKESARMRRALFGIFTSLCLMAALILGGISLDSRLDAASHDVFIDEYRSAKCGDSSQPIPHRMTRIEAKEECVVLRTAGENEGLFYGKAKCSGPNGTFDGNARLHISKTLEECKGGDYTVIPAGSCLSESMLFPTKPLELQEFLSVSCIAAERAKERWERAVGDYVTPDNGERVAMADVPSLYSFFSSSSSSGVSTTTRPPSSSTTSSTEQVRFFRGNRRHQEPILRGKTGAASLISASVKDSTSILGRSELVLYDNSSTPRSAENNQSKTAMSSLGTLYNDFGLNNGQSRQEHSMAADANRYMGIRETVFDLGTHEAFTLTFWLKATNSTRGFVVVGTDNWYNRHDFSSPIVERVLDILESGHGNSPQKLFDDDWHLYFGLYLNGPEKTMSLIYANPRSEGGNEGVKELKWVFETANTRTLADELFEGEWHFISIGFSQDSGRRYAHLFIDGRTSYTDAGWRVCFERNSYFEPMRNPANNTARINNIVTENVLQDGLLYAGYLNAGLFDFQVHSGLLQQEAVIGLGAKGMEAHTAILVNESRLLGYFAVFLFFFFLIIAVAYLLWGIRQNRKLVKQDEDENGNTQQQGSSGTAASPTTGNATFKQGARASQGSSQLKYMLPVVLNTAQTMAIYFSGWKWPHDFEVNVSYLIFWLAFDINLAFPQLPALASPALQVFVAVCVVMILLSMVGDDHDSFVRQIQNSGDLPNPDEETKAKYTLKFSVKKHGLIVDDPKQQTELYDLFRKMWRRLRGTDPLTHLDEVNIKFSEKKTGDTIDIPCTITMMRPKVKSSHITVIVKTSLSAPAGVPSFEEKFKCKLNELVGKCPIHGETLIKAVDTVHKQVVDDDGELRYHCAYDTTAATLYRLMHPNEKYNVCPGIEDDFYVCGADDTCGFAVCSDCSEHSTPQKLVAVYGSKKYAYEKLGILATFGFIVLLIAQSVHMPIMKNALMIIYCHPNYHCDFPSCYENPSTEFVLFVIFAIIIAGLMGVGLIFFMVYNVVRRKKFIHLTLDELFDEENNMSNAVWMGLVLRDNSMLKNIYEPYTFKYMWVQPMTLVFKLLTVLPIVFAEPNSLTQLVTAFMAELIQLLFYVFTNPFTDHWIGFTVHVGSLHNILQLGLMGFYRAAIFLDPSDDEMATYMIVLACVYAFVVITIIVLSVIAPFVREYLRKRKEQQLHRDHLLKELKDRGQGQSDIQGNVSASKLQALQLKQQHQQQRPLPDCKYGGGCRRKNKKHWEDFYHPPACPYGLHCLELGIPSHTLEFSHPPRGVVPIVNPDFSTTASQAHLHTQGSNASLISHGISTGSLCLDGALCHVEDLQHWLGQSHPPTCPNHTIGFPCVLDDVSHREDYSHPPISVLMQMEASANGGAGGSGGSGGQPLPPTPNNGGGAPQPLQQPIAAPNQPSIPPQPNVTPPGVSPPAPVVNSTQMECMYKARCVDPDPAHWQNFHHPCQCKYSKNGGTCSDFSDPHRDRYSHPPPSAQMQQVPNPVAPPPPPVVTPPAVAAQPSTVKPECMYKARCMDPDPAHWQNFHHPCQCKYSKNGGTCSDFSDPHRDKYSHPPPSAQLQPHQFQPQAPPTTQPHQQPAPTAAMKPECKYGARCMTRDPQHWTRYHHPRQCKHTLNGGTCSDFSDPHRDKYSHPPPGAVQ